MQELSLPPSMCSVHKNAFYSEQWALYSFDPLKVVILPRHTSKNMKTVIEQLLVNECSKNKYAYNVAQ